MSGRKTAHDVDGIRQPEGTSVLDRTTIAASPRNESRKTSQ
jgi:hypothetical protein